MRSSGREPTALSNIEGHIAHGHKIVDTIVGERFHIRSLTNVGGMGLVYEAHDLLEDGKRVAVKVMPPMNRSGNDARERFFREAEVLASLRHPGIVAYVAHGLTHDQRPYLAMEWLDGEELETLLERQPLPAPQAVLLLRRIADALAFAHDRGITHRDLKPANIVLRNGLLDNPAIVDFGVARWIGRTLQMTRAGMLVGTPGYMAPEQARGQTDIGPSADIFALGCILYQTLIGKAPFAGDNVAAALTKVLFEEVPPIRFHRPDMPESLELLLSRMLLKNASERPRNARALLAELDELGLDFRSTDPNIAITSTPARKALTNTEQALFCLVLATPERNDASDEGTVLNATVRTPFVDDANWPRETLENLGVQLESLADGSLAMIVGHGASAKEHAATGARCASLLLKRNPSARVTLVMGRGVRGPRGGVPEGEVFERASALLKKRALVPMTGPNSESIWIDEMTADVLGSGYPIERTPAALLLIQPNSDTGAEATDHQHRETLTCVGREREIRQLLSALDGVIEDERCAAVVLIGVPGMGKSRLMQVFLNRVRERLSDVTVLYGHGEPTRNHSNYGLIANVFRKLAGVTPEDSPTEQRRKITVRLGTCSAKTNTPLELEPLIDLCVPRDATINPPPVWQALEKALTSWLVHEATTRPILIAIDDTHWADASTIRFVDNLLRSATNLPLFVLTTNHETSQQRTPLPWHGCAQNLRLSGLSKRAAGQLVRMTLGDEAPSETVAQLVHDAAGSPLILEELIRSTASGHGNTTPRALLAILQARMKHLSSGARRALRAASLFGQTFWRRGVTFLLGLDRSTDEQTVGRWLDELLDTEFIVLHAESRFSGDTEYGFRSVHVREAASRLLTDGDRDLGQVLVNVFLEQVGEDDAVLAGATYEIVQYLQKRHNAYFVSRLSMLTGIPLHTFKRGTPDDPTRLKKLRLALGRLLHDDEIAESRHLFRDV